MAKTRQQRKAERRRRQQAAQAPKLGQGPAEPKGQARTAGAAAEVEPEVVEPDLVEPEVVEPEVVEPAVEPAETAPIEAEPAEAEDESAAGGPAPEAAALEAPAPPKAKKRRKERRREAKPARRTERRPGGVRERSRVASFLSEVRAELKRVQWPDRQTLMQATGVVIVTVLIAATYLGVLDFIFSKLIRSIL